MFGAKCYTELSNVVTHVVAAKHGTVKVDAARKRGGMKIVWLAWFTDSIALWRRQDETPYLLDDPSPDVTQPTSILDSSQVPTDPELGNDDWDEDVTEISKAEGGAAESLNLADIDWNDVNDEVDAAMNESDDEDSRSDKSGMRSGNVSEEEESWTDGSQSGISITNLTPRKRKRLRSITPSEMTVNGNKDSLRSPLAKRKKLAAARSGASRLKDSISAGDLAGSEKLLLADSTKEDLREEDEEEEEDNEDDEEEEIEGDIDDDFLAGALEEDWG